MILGLYETRREEIARDFFRYLHDFSNGGWYGGEYRQQGSAAPHLLREEYHYQDSYFGTMFSMAQQLLQNAYEDSGAHQYASLMAVLISPREEKPASQWSRLFPEVEQIISAHGPDVKKAFETLFEICKIYQKSVEDTPSSSHNGKRITTERHGLTQELADQLHEALIKIWQAYPEVDTRISEGFDYAMSDPIARKTFTFPASIGGTSGFSIGEHGSEARSDYRLAEMMERYNGETLMRLDVWKHSEKIQPEQLSAIASQTFINLEKLQDFSIPIAERCVSGFLKVVCRKDDCDSDDAAKEILSNLATGTTTVEQEAQKIRKGRYGALAGGYTNWMQKDDNRKRALAVIDNAPDYLSLCVGINSGEWFGQENDKITALCAEKNLPGFGVRSITAAPTLTFF